MKSFPQYSTLRQHRELLNDLHREIENRGGREGDLFERAYSALLSLTIEYFTADWDPEVRVTVRRRA